MSKPVYVIGHKNPDTDSICSAIAYAYLKNALGGGEYQAARAGKLHLETQFVLDYFGVEAPPLLTDVKARVEDMLNGDTPVAVLPGTPLREVGILTRTHNIKTIPIVDEQNHFLGLVTLGDIAHKYMQELGLENLGKMHVTLGNIIRTLNGQLLSGPAESTELTGNVIIGAMAAQTMADYISPGDVVILGNREEAQLTALAREAACLIITCGYTVSDRVRAEAEKRGAALVSVPHDTFAAARLINMSAPVSSLMRPASDCIVFQADDLADEAKKVMLETRYRNYPVVDENNRFLGVVSRYHLLALSRKKVILVDHNEKSQAVDGLEQAEILEVIDHHRVGDIQTGQPIFFRNEPVGCTATIVAGMYRESGVEIPRTMAGLMLGAILSDTVLFKSPTCTKRDEETARWLAEIAGVDIDQFGLEMYKAGTSLVGRTNEEIIYQDFKEFKMGPLTLGIGQVETMDLSQLAQLKAGLLADMEAIRKEKGLDLVLLMITDILQEGTELLVTGPESRVVEETFGQPLVDQAMYLPGVMSRKKQVVPPLTAHLSK
ncbi:manganese-dependent inorganic pyrophosphatase [Carboxydocella sporoproducens DSM 16521]|uniref:inorganic diphosphatase n=2 Tax=Carboxydocella TaxID=178898 RepID=A0A1T4RAY7_9FIRM|nr:MULTISPECIES: putative manganese-dependent inorganic diphosphatase [Carboxydocella]AVX19406.1 manganese-dependent inorganic pyrophosphatase [Carboxydocella thermautotrophica]AVX29819.1 manganese-dependent inorganic pyrophosphatase [Carboxydocella thermautotrophica]SKA13222.1 manganese-dependent inorganic pyrophosphatase [Carboxydocella sporoproducens DSM 16521]